jgi:sigma-B regulation protein RsbU (phosphoserine phosphatase)
VAVTSWIVSNPQILSQAPKKTASQINDFICTLLKKDTRDSVSESIDMAVAKIDLDAKILRLTSAKTRVIILRQGELILTMQDKTSIGDTSYNSATSTSQVISLEDGDRVIFLTDGMVDQLDQDGKRFGTANFKTILRKSALLPLEQQRNYIREQIEKFRGDTAQTDDMTLLMIEI